MPEEGKPLSLNGVNFFLECDTDDELVIAAVELAAAVRLRKFTLQRIPDDRE